MLFLKPALLWEHYGAAEQVTWLMTHPLSRWGATYWYDVIEVNFFPKFK